MLFCRLHNFIFEGFSGDRMLLAFKEVKPNVKQIWFMGQSESRVGVFKIVQIYPFVDNSIDSIRPDDKPYLQEKYHNFINEMITNGKFKKGLNGEYFLNRNEIRKIY